MNKLLDKPIASVESFTKVGNPSMHKPRMSAHGIGAGVVDQIK